MGNISDKKLTEQEILNVLDLSNDGYYSHFVSLGDTYSYLIDARLNVFRGKNNRWTIAVERLGYNPRADAIVLNIFYYGNCLINLETYNNRNTNYYQVFPIDNDNFKETIEVETLKLNAKFWLVRGQKVSISYNKQDYFDAGVELEEYKSNEISVEEAGRLVVSRNRDSFRATDNELYKSIPKDLEKILVLDEWYHKDFDLTISPKMTKEYLKQTYELNKKIAGNNSERVDDFFKSYRYQMALNDEWNREMWKKNRPSTYETWQQIAKVIVANNSELYKPTIKPNTYWRYWMSSGSL